jgi:hypothetical protein
MISLWGALMSYVNGIPQLNHLEVTLAFVVLIFGSIGVHAYCEKNKINFNTLLLIIVSVILLNSIIILIETNSLAFKNIIEHILRPAGNIDYLDPENFRFRGLAASGGAGLSVALPMALICSFELYRRRVITEFILAISTAIFFSSGLVIGRTGLLFLPIAVLVYFAFNFKYYIDWRRSTRMLTTLIVLIVVSYAIYIYISAYFSEQFGSGFMQYALDFMLEGGTGFKNEGTVKIILHFLTVLPYSFPWAVTGYGFYGGSNFSPWTDSGYPRMFLSVGFILGFIYYICIFFIYAWNHKKKWGIVAPMIIILIFAELKEVLLFSGIASRMFIIVSIFLQLESVKIGRYDLR